MKFNKFISALFLSAVVFLAAAFPADAQIAKPYRIFDGTTYVIPTASTNVYYYAGLTNTIGSPGTSSNLVLTVAEFDNVGFTFKYTPGSGCTNAPVGIAVFRSFDGGTIFETVQGYVWTNGPTALTVGTSPVIATNLDVRGATHIAFVPYNLTTGWATNVFLEINLKSPKYGARQATQ